MMLSNEKWVRDERDFSAELGRGDNDGGAVGNVMRVQEWVSFHRFVTGVDGDYGSATEKAVRQFQSANSLPATGRVDQTTFVALTAPLAAVLQPPAPPPGTLSEAILAVARQHLAMHPVEIGGPNSGPWVRLYMRGRHGPNWLWCAGFACTVVRQASEVAGVTCPIKYRISCDDLATDAKNNHKFMPGSEVLSNPATSQRITPGSLFLIRSASNPTDWTHTGVVIAADGDSFTTIEGNTDANGTSNGFEVCHRERGYGRADFVLI